MKITLLSVALFLSALSFSQVGIGTISPDASAQLDVVSNNKGFLPPRMTSAQRIAIGSPASGLTVYQTDGSNGLYYYDGDAWKAIASGTSSGVTSVGAISGSSTANGATITSGILYLAPANATNGGIVTTTTQTIAGVKTFNADMIVNRITVGGGSAYYQNTIVGENALRVNTTGSNNTVMGMNSLFNNTTGASNTAIGMSSLYNNTTGTGNTAIGLSTLSTNNLGIQNSAFGSYALNDNTEGTNNTASGFFTLLSNTTGSNNTASGNKALINNTTGSNNTAIGDNSGNGITTGSGNTLIGAKIGYYVSLFPSLTNNIILANGTGDIKAQHDGTNWTMQGNVTATSLIKSGGTPSQFLKADGSVDSATYLTAAGTATNVSGVVALANGGTGTTTKAAAFNALSPMTTAGDLIYGGISGTGSRLGIGTNGQVLTLAGGIPAWATPTSGSGSFVDLTTAQTIAGVKTFSADAIVNTITVGTGPGDLYSRPSNTAVGFRALYSNTSGYFNTANGYEALKFNTAGVANTANGYSALTNNTTGNFNTAYGNSALETNTTASYNTANGQSALFYSTSGGYNTANGASALFNNTTGTNNTANGSYSLYNNIGEKNTADGSAALLNITTGGNNTALGHKAGNGITTGSGNTILGANVESLSSALTNNIILANGTGAIKAQHDGTNWTMQGTVAATQFQVSALNTAPATATATGTAGEIRVTASYIYVCTATNIWVRTALSGGW